MGTDLDPRRAAPRLARFPPNGAWPGVMRADMVAAFFDLETVAALHRALARGEVPRPTDARARGKAREPLWSLDTCRSFVARRHELASDAETDNLAALV